MLKLYVLFRLYLLKGRVFFCLLFCSHLNTKEWTWLNIDISSVPIKPHQPIRFTKSRKANERLVKCYIGSHLSCNIIMSGRTDGIQGNLCLSSLYLVNYTNTALKMIIFILFSRVLPPMQLQWWRRSKRSKIGLKKIVKDGGRRSVSRLPDLQWRPGPGQGTSPGTLYIIILHISTLYIITGAGQETSRGHPGGGQEAAGGCPDEHQGQPQVRGPYRPPGGQTGQEQGGGGCCASLGE